MVQKDQKKFQVPFRSSTHHCMVSCRLIFESCFVLLALLSLLYYLYQVTLSTLPKCVVLVLNIFRKNCKYGRGTAIKVSRCLDLPFTRKSHVNVKRPDERFVLTSTSHSHYTAHSETNFLYTKFTGQNA